MTTEASVISALRTALATITKTNGYNTNVAKVIQGFAGIEEIEDRPALVFNVLNRAHALAAVVWHSGILNVEIWGYIDVEEEDFTAAIRLMDDLEVMFDTWSQSEFTRIVNTTRYFGGVREEIGLFMMEIEVTYYYDQGST